MYALVRKNNLVNVSLALDRAFPLPKHDSARVNYISQIRTPHVDVKLENLDVPVLGIAFLYLSIESNRPRTSMGSAIRGDSA